MTDNIFITDKIKKPQQTDQILKELNILDSEVRAFTENRGHIDLIDITEEDAKILFGSKSRNVGENNFLIDFKYTLTDDDQNEYKYRNRLGYISYNGNFPIYGLSDLLENTNVHKIETQEKLQIFIKKIVQTVSFRRSLYRAKDGKKTTSKPKITVHKNQKQKNKHTQNDNI